MSGLDSPHRIMARLQELEEDLGKRQNALESAARNWFVAKRERERDRAATFLTSEGTVAERNAYADRAHARDGAEAEAEYEALKAVCRVIETRVGIGQSLLKGHGRAGA